MNSPPPDCDSALTIVAGNRKLIESESDVKIKAEQSTIDGPNTAFKE